MNRRRRAGRWGVVVGGAGTLVALLVAKTDLPPHAATAAPSDPPIAAAAHETPEAPVSTTSYTSLGQAMRQGFSPAFGELSIYGFHGMELTEESLPSAVEAAELLRRTARELPLLGKRNLSIEEREFFERLAAELGVAAAELPDAVRARDGVRITRLMTRIDASCQSCHARLAPHLVEEK